MFMFILESNDISSDLCLIEIALLCANFNFLKTKFTKNRSLGKEIPNTYHQTSFHLNVLTTAEKPY